jgi:hypothetical protein
MTANLIHALPDSGQAAAVAMPAAAAPRHEMPARDLIAELAGRAG